MKRLYNLPQEATYVIYSRNRCSNPEARSCTESSHILTGVSRKLSTDSLVNLISSTAECAYGSFFDFGFHVYKKKINKHCYQ